MAEEEDYYSDDLELLEEHDLAGSGDSDESVSDNDSDHGFGKLRHAGTLPSDAEQEHDQDADQLEDHERVDALRVPILAICSALGGYEELAGNDGKIDLVYQLGDDCLGCLRDLRKLWRQDDTDPSRAVARVFAQINVLHNDLVPILLQTAGRGGNNDKIALACTDLITAMTWPVDAMAEIHDAVTKDEDTHAIQSLPDLERAQVQYKSSILRQRAGPHDDERDVLSVVLRHILLPSLSKPRVNRNERDIGIIGMCLHLFRNLLAIRDPVATTLSSTDTLANANLQSSLIIAMSKTHVLETLLMLASSAETREFNPWNAVTAECIYHIFVGTSVSDVAEPGTSATPSPASSVTTAARSSSPVTSSALSESLAAESRLKRASILSTGSSRHSRFGTTINFIGPDGERRVARSQAALRKSVEQLTHESINRGKRRVRRRRAVQEKGAPKLKSRWTKVAAVILQEWADRFMQSGFEPLSKSVLHDIRSEREKIGDLDKARIRVMQLGTYFLEYFMLRRSASEARAAEADKRSDKGKARAMDDKDSGDQNNDEQWPYSLISQWLEPWAFKMVLVRSADAKESKAWLEFVSSVSLWTVLLRLVDRLSRSKKEDEHRAAEGLQAQHYYQAETLEACQAVLRAYTAQSFACLDAIVSFASVMPRMLERYSANVDHMYVRAKRRTKESEESARHARSEAKAEREFKYNDFERKLATRQLANACVHYLRRWREYTVPGEQLARVVGVMHRLAVRANQYRLFFPGHLRGILHEVLTGAAMDTLPQPKVGDLRKLLEYIMRKFSKLDEAEKEAWNYGKPPPREREREVKVPAEIRVKPGFGTDEQIGIAIGLLVQKEKMARVLWVKGELDAAAAAAAAAAGADAGGEGYEMDYAHDNELRLDASVLPELKLLCRLVGAESDESDRLHWRWRVPASVAAAAAQRAALIEHYLASPFVLGDGDDRPLASLVMRVRKPRPAAAAHASASLSESEDEDEATRTHTDDESASHTPSPVQRERERERASTPATSISAAASPPPPTSVPRKTMRRPGSGLFLESDDDDDDDDDDADVAVKRRRLLIADDDE